MNSGDLHGPYGAAEHLAEAETSSLSSLPVFTLLLTSIL